MPKAAILEKNRNEILSIARRHGVRQIRVFGSAARAEMGPDSDVDLLIEVEGLTPPWFPGGLVAELESLLHCRVDVVEPSALRESLRAHVLQEAVPL